MIKAPQTQRGVRLVFETGLKCSGLKLARTWLTGHSGIVGNQGSTGGWGEVPQQGGKDKAATRRRLASRISGNAPQVRGLCSSSLLSKCIRMEANNLLIQWGATAWCYEGNTVAWADCSRPRQCAGFTQRVSEEADRTQRYEVGRDRQASSL